MEEEITIVVVIAFIGVGVAWAMEQGSPQFQEKAGTPIVKKHKKFPWLIALLGVAAVGVGIYFLTKKKTDDNSGGDYTITLQNKDVVTDAAVNGNLLVKLANGTQVTGTSGGQFKLTDSNSISDIVVTDAAGHYTGYAVFTDSDGNVVSRRGILLLNSGFIRAAQGEIAGCSHARLHYSRRNHALILEFTRDGKKPGALKLSAPHFGCTIAAKSFFNKFGLAVVDVAGRYEPAIEEILGLGRCWVVYLKGGKPAE